VTANLVKRNGGKDAKREHSVHEFPPRRFVKPCKRDPTVAPRLRESRPTLSSIIIGGAVSGVDVGRWWEVLASAASRRTTHNHKSTAQLRNTLRQSANNAQDISVEAKHHNITTYAHKIARLPQSAFQLHSVPKKLSCKPSSPPPSAGRGALPVKLKKATIKLLQNVLLRQYSNDLLQ
jgi:hypothetical protein